MKISVEKRNIVPGADELTCEVWNPEDPWATKPTDKPRKTFLRIQPAWKFYFPLNPEEVTDSAFHRDCENMNDFHFQPNVFFIDDYFYTNGFVYEPK